jgi:glycosyltransferase involved in cell wall biosynthesis
MTAELERVGFGAGDYRVMRADPQDVPRFLGAADVALSIIRASVARVASSPTKFAEYLAAGLPVISGTGIGDMDEHIAEGRVGVLLRSFDRTAYVDALRELETLRRDPELAERCRQTARARYDLETIGGVRYRRIYEALS